MTVSERAVVTAALRTRGTSATVATVTIPAVRAGTRARSRATTRISSSHFDGRYVFGFLIFTKQKKIITFVKVISKLITFQKVISKLATALLL